MACGGARCVGPITTGQEELIPGVFYTAKGENLPVQMSVRSFAKLFSQVGRTTVFNLEIEGDGTHPVLIWARSATRSPAASRTSTSTASISTSP